MMRAIALTAASLSLALTAQASPAEAQLRVLKPAETGVIVADIQAVNTERMTTFDPAVHGFNFGNRFRNNFISEFDIRTGGLCGGMVWAALDYWRAGKEIPQQTYLPTEGSVLQSYIYNRQVISLTSNLDRWGELTINPGGERNNEYWRWGMEGKPGGQLDLLKRSIDAGRPVPLGLLGCNEDCNDHHQVLAIGYDAGRYKGDLGRYQTDLRIFLYDPNQPGKKVVMRTNPTTRKFYFEDDPDTNWRTYFVDTKWTRKNAPEISALERELLITFETGEDDLRGGNDNIHVYLKRRSGSDIPLYNANKGKRWITNSSQTVAFSLPQTTSYDQLTGVRVQHRGANAKGSVSDRQSADNWDLRRILVRTGDADGKKRLFSRSGSPLHRFDSWNRDVSWNFAASAARNELIVTFFTGTDDLRGGNDNADLFIMLRDGRRLPFRNVNESRKWENGATITRYLELPRGITHSDITGAQIVTRFGGGMGGDNWNLQSLRIKTREGGTERQLFYAAGDRNGPLFRFKGERSARSKTWRF